MSPVLETLANRLDNVIKVAKVDTDKSPRVSVNISHSQIIYVIGLNFVIIDLAGK